MYRHLLVPVDGSDLSVEAVGNSVALAHSLGARITFFHAVVDVGSLQGGEGDATYPTKACDAVDHALLGRERELLAKAEAAARAQGVPCDARHAISDKPAEAIVAAARDTGCDLVFIVSHGGEPGRAGTAFASETLSALLRADLSVLVSSAGGPAPRARLIGIVRDEHRSLAAVLHAWMAHLQAARTASHAPDAALLRAILRYMQAFPLALHHPKEETHLFARLRERTHACDAELDELQRQHERDRQWAGALACQVEAVLAAWERVGAGPAAGPDLEAARSASRALEEEVGAYARFQWDHMGREEGVILPAAERYLQEADWEAIDQAFVDNRDPRFAVDAERDFRQLFSRIVSLAG